VLTVTCIPPFNGLKQTKAPEDVLPAIRKPPATSRLRVSSSALFVGLVFTAYGQEINTVMLFLLHYYILIVKPLILLSVKKECKQSFMADKKVFSTRIDQDRIKDLKHLAVDAEKSLGSLLEEAIEDLLKKYAEKVKK
jgi:hypothetical protein